MKMTFLKGVALGSAVSLATVAATAAFAGTGVGSVFNLGQTNRANARSQLEASTPSAVLNVTNSDKSSSASGVSIDVPGSDPPLVVNSTTKVKNLNADLVDGHHASDFQSATSKACPKNSAISSIASNGATDCNSSVVLPINVAVAPDASTDKITFAPSSFAVRFSCSTAPSAQLAAYDLGASPATVSWSVDEDNTLPRVNNIIINPGSESGLFGGDGAVQRMAQIMYLDANTVTTINLAMRLDTVDNTFEGCEFQGTVSIAPK